jgi:hypothetical protein
LLALGQREEGVFDRGVGRLRAARQGADLGRRAQGQLGARRHDEEAVAVFRLLHEMRRDDDRRARQREGVDAPPELAPRDRVDARCGLVEEQDVGLVQQGCGHRETLLVAAGQRRGRGVAGRRQVELFERGVDALAQRAAMQSVGRPK